MARDTLLPTMLNRSDNETVCRVGPGTPMGRLMREYWIPALPSRELPALDGDPVRVLLLGEQLIVLRATRWLTPNTARCTRLTVRRATDKHTGAMRNSCFCSTS